MTTPARIAQGISRLSASTSSGPLEPGLPRINTGFSGIFYQVCGDASLIFFEWTADFRVIGMSLQDSPNKQTNFPA
ncbi:hypothetical protein [Ottowia sp. oral taxon 894]|uniref:hypothetical protein n=1 Tax=Ottowia sp. oral taxon 894 TaxID=1658672 RepID=UPI0012E21D61|nr:hypothetical protein [Ottowia sp. oral taxon 894]